MKIVSENCSKSNPNGVFLIKPKFFYDARGWFSNTYNKMDFPLNVDFIMDNYSFSKNKNTFRGYHIQKEPYTQAKLIQVLKGSITDIILDLRTNSPTYLKAYSYTLSSSNCIQLFIPSGFAHGFITLEADTLVHYKVDNKYSPDHELVLNFNDEHVEIDLGVGPDEITISSKDSQGYSLIDLINELGEFKN
jgi:dTDP-4-dehydrorhamnose 3,5-epimerase